MAADEDIEALIYALQTHRINSLQELRRAEKILAEVGTSDVSEAMTVSWLYYVNSNMLLTELRVLTPNFPFSMYVVDEAKNRVINDPSSNRTWNYCWLVLTKIKQDNLIAYYADYQARQADMWGNHRPSKDDIQSLADAFSREWSAAVDEMLRHWEVPPLGD